MIQDRKLPPDRRSIFVLLAFLALLPALVWGTVRALGTGDNNVEQWLPSDFQASQDYRWYRSHFDSDEFVLVSWPGCTLGDERLDRFAEGLQQYVVGTEVEESGRDDERALFATVTTGSQLLRQLTSPPLSLEREEVIRRLRGWTIGPGDVPHTGAFVTFSEAGNADRAATLALVHEIANDAAGIDAASIRLAGEAVTNAAIDRTSQEAIDELLIISDIVAILVAICCLRSFRLLLVVCGVSTYCFLFAQSTVYFIDFSSFSEYFGGSMNLVLVVMPVLVYVLALSAGVHLVNYYRDEAQNSSILGAPQHAVRVGWRPCALAAGTTIIGVGSLATSHIRPVRDFGSYSAVAILGSLGILFLLLPALLVVVDRVWIACRGGRVPDWPRSTTAKRTLANRTVDRISDLLVRHHVATSAGCIFLLALFAWGASRVETNLVMHRFFSDDHKLVQDYDWLAEKIGPQIPTEIVVRIDSSVSELTTLEQLELTADIESELRQIDSINATMSARTFFRSLEDVAVLNSGTQRDVMNRRLIRYRPQLQEAQVVAQAGSEQLWRIACRSRGLEDSQGYDRFLRQVEQRVDDFLEKQPQVEQERRDRIDNTAANNREKLDAWLTKQLAKTEPGSPERARLQRKHSLARDDVDRRSRLLQQEIKDRTAGVSVVLTGMIPLFSLAQQELFNGLVVSFLLAFVLIALVMVWRLHSVRAGLLVMLPNVFPAVLVFGAMGWADQFLDVGSMMTASVAMGIAVDDTVHFLTWFRRGMAEGMQRRDAVRHAYRRCAIAMLQTTSIAGLSLLVFGFSSFQPVSQFGILMFVLLVGALVGDLLFLPALLVGPAGRWFEESRERIASSQKEHVVAVS